MKHLLVFSLLVAAGFYAWNYHIGAPPLSKIPAQTFTVSSAAGAEASLQRIMATGIIKQIRYKRHHVLVDRAQWSRVPDGRQELFLQFMARYLSLKSLNKREFVVIVDAQSGHVLRTWGSPGASL